MNSILEQTIDKYCPKFNKNVTEGSAKDILKRLPAELDSIFKDSIKSLSPQIPLKYIGYRNMSPEEEYKNIILGTSDKSYDIAVSDVYPIEFIFEFNGEMLIKPLYLPYCERGNLMKISNTYYSITPVLSDTVISPSHKEIFVRLLKDKITIKSVVRNFIFNNERIAGSVIYTSIVKTKQLPKSDSFGTHFTTIFLYLLGKYGLRETLRKYCDVTDFVITDKDITNLRSDYNIWESTKIKPKNYKDNGYIGHNLKICIAKKHNITPILENIVFGIIYTLDVLPDEAENILVGVNSGIVKDEIYQWRIIIGRIAYKNTFSIDRIVQDMTEHFDSLEGYIDSLIQTKLKDNGIRVNDFFDLIALIGNNYNNWVLNSKEYNSDINNRYIDIVYYILYDIIIGFNKIILNLNKRAGKKADGMSKKEAWKIIQNNLFFKTILKLVKATEPNIAIQAQNDSSTDLIYPKVTALLEDQSRGNGVRRGKESQFPEATKTLKGHDLVLGTLLFLNKKAPSPRFRANVYMNYDIFTGRLIIPKELNKIVNKLDDALRGTIVNKNVQLLENDDVKFE